MNNKQIYKSLIFGITIVILLTQNAFTQHSLRMVKVHNDEIGTQTELIGALFGTFNLINTENPVGSFFGINSGSSETISSDYYGDLYRIEIATQYLNPGSIKFHHWNSDYQNTLMNSEFIMTNSITSQVAYFYNYYILDINAQASIGPIDLNFQIFDPWFYGETDDFGYYDLSTGQIEVFIYLSGTLMPIYNIYVPRVTATTEYIFYINNYENGSGVNLQEIGYDWYSSNYQLNIFATSQTGLTLTGNYYIANNGEGLPTDEDDNLIFEILDNEDLLIPQNSNILFAENIIASLKGGIDIFGPSTLRFSPGSGIIIEEIVFFGFPGSGHLFVNGSMDYGLVTFTSNIASERWEGIVAHGSGVTIFDAEISNTNVAVAMILHGGGAIRNTTFNNNYVDIVLAYNTPTFDMVYPIMIQNCTFNKSYSNYPLSIYGGGQYYQPVDIWNCTFNNGIIGILSGVHAHFDISDCNFISSDPNLYHANILLSGYESGAKITNNVIEGGAGSNYSIEIFNEDPNNAQSFPGLPNFVTELFTEEFVTDPIPPEQLPNYNTRWYDLEINNNTLINSGIYASIMTGPGQSYYPDIRNNIIDGDVNWDNYGIFFEIEPYGLSGMPTILYDFNLINGFDHAYWGESNDGSYEEWDSGLSDIINISPNFIEPINNNYHLQWDSPCIDAGDPNFSTDPDDSNSDIGVYYYNQEKGDINGDASIDVLDIALIVNHILLITPLEGDVGLYGSPYWAAEVNGDGSIDVLDIVIITNCVLYPDNCNLGRLAPITGSCAYSITSTQNEFDRINALTRSTDNDLILSISSDMDVAGVQMDIIFDESSIEFIGMEQTEISSDLNLEYTLVYDGVVRFILYPETEYAIPAGEYAILTLQFDGLTRNSSSQGDIYISNPIFAGVGGFKIDVGEEDSIPLTFSLKSAYPNPFNPLTTLKYDLPEDGQVSLIIYDMLGREVTQLVNTFKEAGYYKIQWDGSSHASGMYIVKMTSGVFTQTQKVMLVK